ncbi:coiled-coil-helix-coiled-coil-helix domain-containing protein 2-like [Branchiostoma floridae]|uniref:Coiled-coil-helix-coiled-coil-helix domain-containing protein 2-like n=1 Tax=Branchiostoma floridae TaxID=7739 RepID=A0A9J7LX93_BRAFL|nr:coiled-coil-helix-coiled-coil-helix domain-containing protein 2-like [Branchiostoma floridae]
MPRRGGGFRARTSSPPAPARAPPRSNVPAPAPPSQPMMQQPVSQGPGLMGQMAATAGGVAIGHVVGHAVTGAFSGGGSSQSQPDVTYQEQPAQQQQQQPNQQQQQPCGWEIQQFLQCAQSQSDISLCEGFNEAIRQCKVANGLQ